MRTLDSCTLTTTRQPLRCPSGLQIVAFVQILLKCSIGIAVDSEEMHLALDLLSPLAIGVCCQWKLGIGFLRFRGFVLRHVRPPSKRFSVVVTVVVSQQFESGKFQM